GPRTPVGTPQAKPVGGRPASGDSAFEHDAVVVDRTGPAASADAGPVPPTSTRAGSAAESGPNATAESATGAPGTRPADVAGAVRPHGDEAVAPAGTDRTPLPKSPDRPTAGPGAKALDGGPGGPKASSSQEPPSRTPDPRTGSTAPKKPVDDGPAVPPQARPGQPKDGPAADHDGAVHSSDDVHGGSAEGESSAKALSDRALDSMAGRATAKVEAQEAKAAAAKDAAAEANRSPDEARRSAVPKSPARSAKAKAWREESFQREQKAAGVGEQDLRQLTKEEHEQLADLEGRRAAARHREQAALRTLEKAGKPAPKFESASAESTGAGDQVRGEAGAEGESSAKTPSDRALDSMTGRATAKVEAAEARAAAAKDAADKASRSPYQVRRDERQREFDERMSLVCRGGG
ncbi:hypothetical protein ACFFNX_27170, partial [Actinoallomurus acaciae]